MEHIFWLYLITRLDAIQEASIIAAILLGFSGAMACAYGYFEKDSPVYKLGRRLLAGFAVAIFVSIATPSKSDAMFIAGGTAVIEAAKSETAQRIASKSVAAVEQWLDAQQMKEKQ